MDPIVLAFIIIGDGNFSSGRIRIYLNALAKSEVENVSNSIRKKLKINSIVRLDRNDQYIIVIPASEIKKTQLVIGKYMHNSIKYRIGLKIEHCIQISEPLDIMN